MIYSQPALHIIPLFLTSELRYLLLKAYIFSTIYCLYKINLFINDILKRTITRFVKAFNANPRNLKLWTLMKNDVHNLLCCILMLLFSMQFKSQDIHSSSFSENQLFHNALQANHFTGQAISSLLNKGGIVSDKKTQLYTSSNLYNNAIKSSVLTT